MDLRDPVAVPDGERFDLDEVVRVDEAGHDVGSDHLVAVVGVRLVEGALGDVGCVCLCDVPGHRRGPLRPVHLERLHPPEHPRREHQRRETERVIGVQVGEERPRHPGHGESGDAAFVSLRETQTDPRAEVEEVGAVVDDHGRRRPGTPGLGARCAGAEEDDACPWIAHHPIVRTFTSGLAGWGRVISRRSR